MHEPAGVVENLVQNSTVYPYSAIQNPPPPKMTIVRNLGTLTFQLQNTSPPRKWQLSEILALWLFSCRIPPSPPPRKWQLSEILALWLFSCRIPPSPPRKWQLSEILALLLFSYRIPPQKWQLSEILALLLFSYRIPPLLGTLTFQLQYTPPPPVSPKMIIFRNLGTLTFQLQSTPPRPQKW